MNTLNIDTNDPVLADIRALVEYNWADERRDYQENKAEAGDNHIFVSMKRIDAWLTEQGV